MPEKITTIEDLIIKYLKGELNIEEKTRLDDWLSGSEQNKRVFESLINQKTLQEKLVKFHKTEIGKEEERKKLKNLTSLLPVSSEDLKKDITTKEINFEDTKSRRIWWPVSAAASIIVIVGLASYFFFFNKVKQDDIVKTNLPTDITAPSATKATITLANGEIVLLESVQTGALVTLGNVQVTKNANGEIVYSGKTNEVIYNTLYNPRGSKVVSLTLNDGTKVWLNSESSLKYPIAFSGNERKVEITGEAYFEVTSLSASTDGRQRKLPFIVKNEDVEVEVLGTNFNVNTYKDEANIKVTLLEGSVKVLSTVNSFRQVAESTILKPGQQAQVSNSPVSETGIQTSKNIDIEAVMAWKNGQFKFTEANLETVMREISRWYNVNVIYQAKPTMLFGGKMDRTSSLIQVLKILEESGVHFKLEERTITVL